MSISEGQTSIFVPYSEELSRKKDGLRLNSKGSIPSRGKFFSSPQPPDRLWGTTCLLSNWHQGSYSLGARLQGRQGADSPPSSDEVKHDGVISPLPPTCLYDEHSPRSQCLLTLFGAYLTHSQSKRLSETQASRLQLLTANWVGTSLSADKYQNINFN
jgi:hypothetical protein